MSLNPNSTGNVLFAIQNNSINCSIARQDKQCCYFLSNHEVAMDATHPAGDHHTSSGRAILFEDEASFAQRGSLSYTWSRRGHQPEVATSGKRKGSKVLGAIESFSGRLFYQGIEGRF